MTTTTNGGADTLPPLSEEERDALRIELKRALRQETGVPESMVHEDAAVHLYSLGAKDAARTMSEALSTAERDRDTARAECDTLQRIADERLAEVTRLRDAVGPLVAAAVAYRDAPGDYRSGRIDAEERAALHSLCKALPAAEAVFVLDAPADLAREVAQREEDLQSVGADEGPCPPVPGLMRDRSEYSKRAPVGTLADVVNEHVVALTDWLVARTEKAMTTDPQPLTTRVVAAVEDTNRTMHEHLDKLGVAPGECVFDRLDALRAAREQAERERDDLARDNAELRAAVEQMADGLRRAAGGSVHGQLDASEVHRKLQGRRIMMQRGQLAALQLAHIAGTNRADRWRKLATTAETALRQAQAERDAAVARARAIVAEHGRAWEIQAEGGTALVGDVARVPPRST